MAETGGTVKAGLQAQNILHGVEPGWFARQPEGGADGAGCENPAVEGVVGEGDLLGAGGEDGAVAAGDLAAAQGSKSDIAIPARAGMAVAAADHDISQRHIAPGGNGVAKAERGAGRGVYFLAVMHFQNFGIIGAGGQSGGQTLSQGEDQIYARGIIWRGDDGDAGGGGGDGGLGGFIKPGSAQHPGGAGCGHGGGMGGNQAGGGEVYHQVARIGQSGDVGEQGGAGALPAGAAGKGGAGGGDFLG